jgi:Fe2+ or Zn2+ uptake regulation protein
MPSKSSKHTHCSHVHARGHRHGVSEIYVHFETALKKAKYKITPPRKAIAEALIKLSKPVSVDEVQKTLKNDKQKIDLVTVYRTLSLYADLGLVHRVFLQGRTELFEVAGAHHHHIVCTSCGKIEGIDICTMDQVKSGILKDTSFSQVTGHRFEVFGVCGRCQ